ncbi:hypothetical protein L0F63_004828 [Massospora cicadina]|nr:hypothetical protein L0F63_004828 [Massospora cicadina]
MGKAHIQDSVKELQDLAKELRGLVKQQLRLERGLAERLRLPVSASQLLADKPLGSVQLLRVGLGKTVAGLVDKVLHQDLVQPALVGLGRALRLIAPDLVPIQPDLGHQVDLVNLLLALALALVALVLLNRLALVLALALVLLSHRLGLAPILAALVLISHHLGLEVPLQAGLEPRVGSGRKQHLDLARIADLVSLPGLALAQPPQVDLEVRRAGSALQPQLALVSKLPNHNLGSVNLALALVNRPQVLANLIPALVLLADLVELAQLGLANLALDLVNRILDSDNLALDLARPALVLVNLALGLVNLAQGLVRHLPAALVSQVLASDKAVLDSVNLVQGLANRLGLGTLTLDSDKAVLDSANLAQGLANQLGLGSKHGGFGQPTSGFGQSNTSGFGHSNIGIGSSNTGFGQSNFDKGQTSGFPSLNSGIGFSQAKFGPNSGDSGLNFTALNPSLFESTFDTTQITIDPRLKHFLSIAASLRVEELPTEAQQFLKDAETAMASHTTALKEIRSMMEAQEPEIHETNEQVGIAASNILFVDRLVQSGIEYQKRLEESCPQESDVESVHFLLESLRHKQAPCTKVIAKIISHLSERTNIAFESAQLATKVSY